MFICSCKAFLFYFYFVCFVLLPQTWEHYEIHLIGLISQRIIDFFQHLVLNCVTRLVIDLNSFPVGLPNPKLCFCVSSYHIKNVGLERKRRKNVLKITVNLISLHKVKLFYVEMFGFCVF